MDKSSRQGFMLAFSDALRSIQEPGRVESTACRMLGEHIGANRVIYGEIADGSTVVSKGEYLNDVPSVASPFQIDAFDSFITGPYEEQKQVIISDISTDRRISQKRYDALKCIQVEAAVGVVLVNEGRRVGVMEVHSCRPRNWMTQEVEIVAETAERIWKETRRLKEEMELRASEDKFRTLANSIPAVIWQIDNTGKIVFVNQYAVDATGISAVEIMESGWLGIISTEDYETNAAEYFKALKERRPWAFLCRCRRYDGRWRWIKNFGKPIFDINGVYLGQVYIGIDITDRIDIENALRDSEDKTRSLLRELEMSDKNKDNFISVLSHELRNPLAAISAGIQILDTAEEPNQIAKVRGIIKRQTDQVRKLVDDLLELTRISQGKIQIKKETINLNQKVENAIEDIKHSYEIKGIMLKTKIQSKPIFLYADPMRITQVIGNVLHNALKFTKTGGVVKVTLKADDITAVINIEDNGIGICQEHLQSLFTPFSKGSETKYNEEGLGLGLSIVKGIVNLHGGEITAFSEGLGKGTAFTIYLPLQTPDSIASE